MRNYLPYFAKEFLHRRYHIPSRIVAPAQSHASYKASSLPPSHLVRIHHWRCRKIYTYLIYNWFIIVQFRKLFLHSCYHGYLKIKVFLHDNKLSSRRLEKRTLKSVITIKNNLSPSKRVSPSFQGSSTIFDNEYFHS